MRLALQAGQEQALRVPSMSAINAVGELFQVQWSPGALASGIGPINTPRIGMADGYLLVRLGPLGGVASIGAPSVHHTPLSSTRLEHTLNRLLGEVRHRR